MQNDYLVIDLEATCDRRNWNTNNSEIIEIGAVLVHAQSLQPIGEFQTFVRPIVHPTLTAFCTELTSITQDLVDEAPLFPEAIEQLQDWLGGRTVLMSSWGAYDRNQFSRDRHRHGVTLPWGKTHLNIKAAFAEQQGVKPMGMAGALRRMKIPLEGTHHRGIDDARNIAKLLPFALGRAV